MPAALGLKVAGACVCTWRVCEQSSSPVGRLSVSCSCVAVPLSPPKQQWTGGGGADMCCSGRRTTLISRILRFKGQPTLPQIIAAAAFLRLALVEPVGRGRLSFCYYCRPILFILFIGIEMTFHRDVPGHNSPCINQESCDLESHVR